METRHRRCRTSISRNASSTPLVAPGLDAARSKPAHQAFACGSPDRLGANVSMPAAARDSTLSTAFLKVVNLMMPPSTLLSPAIA